MNWTARYAAFDFHPRLCFPRAAAEPPRRLCSCGVSSVPLFPQESSPALQSTARSSYIRETYVHHEHKKTRTIHPFLIDSSCFTLTKLLLFQPLFLRLNMLSKRPNLINHIKRLIDCQIRQQDPAVH